MARVKRGTKRRARRKKYLKRTKGFFLTKSKLYQSAQEAANRADRYAFRDRRVKKRQYRRLWIQRIGAAARSERTHLRTIDSRTQSSPESTSIARSSRTWPSRMPPRFALLARTSQNRRSATKKKSCLTRSRAEEVISLARDVFLGTQAPQSSDRCYRRTPQLNFLCVLQRSPDGKFSVPC